MKKRDYKLRFYLSKRGCIFYTGSSINECVIKAMTYTYRNDITSFTILRGEEKKNVKFNNYINDMFGYKKIWSKKDWADYRQQQG